ncbi:DUF222 domain-containing protein [Aquihabitans sp. McL0605]|uniref:HNH endonuclease signature motif containing protein n=1 Tax=Aquihabitans sp. McL0605 TaxID=3415671 RepID=UPI003CF5605A
MPATSITATAAEVLARLDEVMAAVAGLALVPGDVSEALALARGVERAGRRMVALQVGVVQAIEDGGLHRLDGHATPAVMVRHAANVSNREAKRRARAGRALRDLPSVASGFAAGSIGVCQVQRIALVHANKRVRARFVALDAQVAVLAQRLPYVELDRRLTNWVLAADEDGTADRSRRNHEDRDVRVTDNYDTSWTVLGSFGSLDGAQLHAILCAFIDAEHQADWAEARARYGDATTAEHLGRTDAQRRADAMTRIFRIAADAWAAAPGGSAIDVNIVIDEETFERHLRRAAGAEVEPRLDLDLAPQPGDPDHPDLGPTPNAEPAAAPHAPVAPVATGSGSTYRCETLDGHPIDPSQAVAHALLARVRRVVFDARGVVIDLGERQRLFTGSARLAVQLAHTHCYWPGCQVPATACQADHLFGWQGGGPTSPGNGAPLCGRHNRYKEHGFTVRPDQRGRLHTHRPDGTRIH